MKKLYISFLLLIAITPIFASKLVRVDVTDDFGDPTGKYYITFDEDLNGTYENSSKSGTLKWNVIVKNEVFSFVLKEDGKDEDVSTSSQYVYYCDTDCIYEVTFKNSYNETKSDYLKLFKSDSYKYNILSLKFSIWGDIESFPELVKYLIDNGSLKIVIKSNYGTYRLGEGAFTGLDELVFDKSPYNEALKLKNEGKYENAIRILADYKKNNPKAYVAFNSALLQAECSKLCGQYFVGGMGPTGGYVFYDCDADNDSGNADGLISTECGWRYLEAAPSDLDGEYVFGYYRPDGKTDTRVGTEIGIGTGESNTEALVKAMGDTTYSFNDTTGYKTKAVYAAKACDAYSIEVNGVIYDDWFLPSKDEMNLMYINMYRNGLGAFKNYKKHWSSSEGSNNSAWAQYFGSGNQDNYNRGSDYYVRPIRAFK